MMMKTCAIVRSMRIDQAEKSAFKFDVSTIAIYHYYYYSLLLLQLFNAAITVILFYLY